LPFPVHIAAIDAGSNAIRLVIARAESPFEIHELATERAPVRLGHNAFTRRRFDEDTIERATKAFRHFRDLMDRYRVEAWRAVATSASREARNRRELVQRVARKSGVKLEVIDGAEEARLARSAVLFALEGKFSPQIILDLGGGSLDVSLLRESAVHKSLNLPLGTVRLMETLKIDGRIHTAQKEAIREALFSRLGPALAPRTRLAGAIAAACGGNAEALAQIAPGERRQGVEALDLRLLRRRLPEIAGRDVSQRIKHFRFRRDRAEVIGIAAVLLDALAEAFDLRTLLVPGVGVREGVLLDLVRSRVAAEPEAPEELSAALRAGALWFGQRFDYDARHAEQVARLALSLFDQLRPLHRMDGEMRLVLEIASLLHDVGKAVSNKSHHRHGEYLVRYGQVPGLKGWRQEMVACLVRYHNHKSDPDLDHKAYAALDREQRRQVRLLAGLLRLAEGLDPDHRQAVRKIRTTFRAGGVEFEVTARSDPAAALAAAQRRAGLFEGELHTRALFRKGPPAAAGHVA
jgi:exopolyphosphatase/guanosine-5'-triphosphate,3'-diphosphate pyrophosphatase